MLAYQTYGAGPQTAVIVHGFLGSGRNLASLARRLVGAHPTLKVVLPDLPGHGQSPPLVPDSNLHTLAAEVLALAESEGQGRPVHLIGHSLGGRVALAALQLAPERLAHLSVLDIGPGPVGNLGGGLQEVLERLMQAPERRGSRTEMRAYFLDAGVPQSLADWIVMNGHVVDDAFVWRIDRTALQQLHRRSSAQDLWPVLASWAVHTPRQPVVSVARGGASNYVTDADLARLTALGCRTTTLPGAGHFVHVDAADALVAWLL